ncbi:MAG: alpha amylase C-terminal domain-containing protein [Bacteroidales bacterium]|nr:alpha amylase C-terminal domain-containing protein [Bacteroidales bacterium]
MMKLVEKDSWLEPVAEKVQARYDKYKSLLTYIESRYGSLKSFASAHEFFGFHYDKIRHGWWYREWAPAAHYLSLFGDFNNWDRYANPLEREEDGVWSVFLPDAQYRDKLIHGSLLKVLVQSSIGEQERIPVYINRVLQNEDNKDFAGQFWNGSQRLEPHSHKVAKSKSKSVSKSKSLFIYESHIGMAQEKEGVGTYKEFKENILPRIKDAGYNAIQLMAIAEHPYYGSFGYHVSNFFAASSRFGTPEELKDLIDTAHTMGIKVIMDLVHSHTVKNTYEGINLFDGTEDQYLVGGHAGYHPQWDSKLFNYGKIETLRLLLSNVRYWLEEYNFDGFRFDGVTSMLYHNHGIGVDFGSQEDYFGDNVNNDAVTYLQLANTLIHQLNEDNITIAEDVSGMPGICASIEDGGIGFDYRLGMGLPDFWIKVLKDQRDEEWNMHEFFFTMTNRLYDVKTIAYAESHDQALVGDKTLAFRLMDKEMYTSMSKSIPNMIVDRGIALHKMIRLFTISLGGNAWLNFMGNEFGHPEWIDFPRLENEWSYKHARRQWSLVDDKNLKYHWLNDFDREMLKFIKDNDIMNAEPAWLMNADEEKKTIVFERNNLIFVFNWGNESIPDYEINVKQTGDYKVVFTTDESDFGGYDNIDKATKFPTEQRGDKVFMKIYNVSRTAVVYQCTMNNV